MNNITKEKVKASGFKYKHLAKQLEIHPQYFSMVMRGERSLSLEKEDQLKELLKHVIFPIAKVA
jgi:plasmid maintenance system antidote protein VapI